MKLPEILNPRNLPSLRPSKAPDLTRQTVHKCNEIKQPFVIKWKRLSEDEKFIVDEIIDHLPSAQHTGKRLSLFKKKKGQERATYNDDEFDWRAIKCPWCFSEEAFVYCRQCNEFCCGRGRFKKENESWYTHSTCGRSFSLKSLDSFETAKVSFSSKVKELGHKKSSSPLLGGPSGHKKLK